MISKLIRLIKEDCGASSPEYAILAALIAGVIVATVAQIGGSASIFFSNFTSLWDSVSR